MGFYSGYDCDICGQCEDFETGKAQNELINDAIKKGYHYYKGMTLCEHCYNVKMNKEKNK